MNEFPARDASPNHGGPSWRILVPVVIVVGLVAVVSLAAFAGMSATFVHTHALPATAHMAVTEPRPDANCTDPVLRSIVVSPANISVKGLGTQVFNATAVSSCGSPMTEGLVVSWALSASDLGTLNATTGTSVTYTACLAPMGGSLRVTGILAGVIVSSRAIINVWHSPDSSTSSGSSPPGPAPDPPWVHVATLLVSPALAAAGVAVFLWGQRSSRGPPKPTV